VEQDARAGAEKGTVAPKITKSSYDAMRDGTGRVPATPPSAEEQAAATVAQCIKRHGCTRSRAECTPTPEAPCQVHHNPARSVRTVVRLCRRARRNSRNYSRANTLQIMHGGAVMIIIIADVDEVAALLDMDEARQPEIVRPQTSGPCVHYDEQTEYAADAYPAPTPTATASARTSTTRMSFCPVKDTCYAMHEVARMRDVCEASRMSRSRYGGQGAGLRDRRARVGRTEPDDGALRTTPYCDRKPANPNA